MYKNLESYLLLVFGCLLSLNTVASQQIFSRKTIVRVAWDQTDRNDTGSDFRSSTVDIKNDPVACRERRDDTETSQQGCTYIKFDLTEMTPAMVNAPGFKAELCITYANRVNSLIDQPLSVAVSVVPAANLWDNSPGLYPLATWVAAADLTPGYLAVDYTLIDNIPDQVPPQNKAIDVTSDIKAWVNGTMVNNGYVLFGTSDMYQGAGFSAPYLITTGAPVLTDHWSFDEQDGITAFNSTGGTNGTFVGAVTVNHSGKINKAYDFGSGESWVRTLGYKGITNTMSRSVSLWIKTASGANLALLSWGNDSNTSEAWDIITDSQRVRVNLQGGFRIGSTEVFDDEWHQIVVTFPGDDGSPGINDVNIYVDGVLEIISSEILFALKTANVLDVALGSNRHRDFFYFGLMDDPAIWCSALTSGEVKSLFEMANEPALNYNAAEVQSLWNLFYGDSQGVVEIKGRQWRYVENLEETSYDGELIAADGESFILVMDALDGRGLISLTRGTIIFIQ